MRGGFIILLLAADVVRSFGENLKLYRITAAPQKHRWLRLMLNLSAQPDEGIPSFNNTMDR